MESRRPARVLVVANRWPGLAVRGRPPGRDALGSDSTLIEVATRCADHPIGSCAVVRARSWNTRHEWIADRSSRWESTRRWFCRSLRRFTSLLALGATTPGR